MKEKKQLLDNIVNGIKEKKGKNITTIDLKNIPGALWFAKVIHPPKLLQ